MLMAAYALLLVVEHLEVMFHFVSVLDKGKIVKNIHIVELPQQAKLHYNTNRMI